MASYILFIIIYLYLKKECFFMVYRPSSSVPKTGIGRDDFYRVRRHRIASGNRLSSRRVHVADVGLNLSILCHRRTIDT